MGWPMAISYVNFSFQRCGDVITYVCFRPRPGLPRVSDVLLSKLICILSDAEWCLWVAIMTILSAALAVKKP